MLMIDTWVEVSGEAEETLAAQKAEAHATEELSTKYPVIETPQSDAMMVKHFQDDEGKAVVPGSRTVAAPASAPIPRPAVVEAPPVESAPPPAGENPIPPGGIVADKGLFGLLMQLKAAVEYGLENEDDSRTIDVMEQLEKLQVSIPPPAEMIAVVG